MKIELFDKAFFWWEIGSLVRMLLIAVASCVFRVWTQGSTRIYKAVDGKVTTSNHIIHIRNQSMLAMLPDPVSFVNILGVLSLQMNMLYTGVLLR